MLDPVLSCVFGQREAFYALFVDVIVQMEKKSETGLREDGVCGSGMNVISREVSERGCEAI